MNELTKDNHSVTVHPEDDLVANALPPLRAKFKEVVAAGALSVTVDLATVEMVDSAGLGLLIAAHNSLKKLGGDLEVIHASNDILQLFKTMRIHQHFKVSGN